MGNTELKTVFKNVLKDQSIDKLGLTPEILFEDKLVEVVETFIKGRMNLGEIDKEKTFPENNVQQNDNAEEVCKQQLACEINENHVAGFATA